MVTASGPFNKAMAALKVMFSNCDTFINAVASISETEDPLDHIYLGSYEVEDESAVVRPFVVIYTEGAMSVNSFNTSSGVLLFTFESQVSDDVMTSYEEGLLAFTNVIETIITEAMQLSATPGNLLIRRIEITEGPGQLEDGKKPIHAFGCRGRVYWGLTD